MTALTTRLRALLPQRSDLADMRAAPRADLLAGLTVAIVALPLALGFGAAAGLGPASGLATAVVAGFIAAAMGGSNLQISGPTGAMTVVLIPIIAEHGPGGVFTVGLMAGVMLLGLALIGAGRFMRYMPVPVIEGFTLGIAIVIFLQQLPAAVGIDSASHHVAVAAWEAMLAFIAQPQWFDIGLACAVAVVMRLGAHWRPGIPFSLLAVAVATAATAVFRLDVPLIGALPKTLPAPSLDFLSPATFGVLLGPAVAVALLAALESLLSATVADQLHGRERHHANRELFGQGLANLASPLFGGMPATAAIARTAVNVRSGARSRSSAMWHALILAMFMLVAAPVVGAIPLSALAGVLLATTIGMVNRANLAALAKATRSDGVVMALTTVATVALDLVMGVVVGLVAAAIVAIVKVAASLRVHADHPRLDEHHDERASRLGEDIKVYRLHGPLFFAAGPQTLLAVCDTACARAVVLHMAGVTTVDASGALALRELTTRLSRRQVPVFLSGVLPEHHGALAAVGALAHTASGTAPLDSVEQAITAARDRLRTSSVH